MYTNEKVELKKIIFECLEKLQDGVDYLGCSYCEDHDYEHNATIVENVVLIKKTLEDFCKKD
jgi:hypothetical protein